MSARQVIAARSSVARVETAVEDFGACDCCGGPRPKTGWRLLELSAPTRRKFLGTDTWTWQLCAVCFRRKLKLGGRLLVPAAASRVGVKG